MAEPENRKASPRWSAVVDRLNAMQHERQAAARPSPSDHITRIAEAFRADPVGAFLRDYWVAWARSEQHIENENRIAALIDFANGTSTGAPDTLPLAIPIDRELWRSRLQRIADADNAKVRAMVQQELAPELIREIRDNAVFVVDQEVPERRERAARGRRVKLSISELLPLRMLDGYGSIASFSYATLLLLDPNGQGRTLCACRLPGCGVFYFAPVGAGPGRKKTSYCPEHTEDGPKAVNRKAQRKWRKNNPRKKSTKPQRTARKTQEL
ncbi:MAG: hypothetical protein R3E75_08110 [Steroidobacteraceae bacterium]|nr:hypothetical protein [Nevskiaceae bacterium]MCP5467029.1 hypothetical protein [Nevskiaceae bacterium]MCP5472304.1 hypothetical protein [Nevskiaceae bacterium]